MDNIDRYNTDGILAIATDFSSSDESSLIFPISSPSSSSSSECEEGVRIKNFLETIEEYSYEQFRKHFRVNRPVAEILIDKYKNYRQRENHGGRQKCGEHCEIYLTLWYLSNTETYRQISDRFNVTKSSVFRILNRVVNFFVIMSPEYIKWPTATEMRESQFKFQAKKCFPKVIGAIDGTHIRISAPSADKEAFYNRKKYYSILLQGIVNSEKKFIDIHCGEPGAMHDARLFRKSSFYKKVQEDRNIIIPGGIILGDSAYPELDYLIPPYKDLGNLTQKQKKFNYLHSATRIVVENAFGLLKGRFRRLKFFESPNIAFITNCVVAACVLHNICLAEQDTIDEEWLLPDEENEEDIHDLTITNLRNEGVRQQIFNELDCMNLLN